MKDLHEILDLMDEAIAKTDLFLSIDIGTSFVERTSFVVDFLSYKMEDDGQIKRVFSECFYVRAHSTDTSEEYMRCRDYLKSLIAEGDRNA